MSHNVHVNIYPENVNRKSVQKYWDDYAAHEDWQEGCCGLASDIRWIENHICASYQDAQQYIQEHDRGGYDQLAVKFRHADNIPQTSALKERLLRQIQSYQQKKIDFSSTHSISKLKADYISCPVCKSKLARIYLVNRHAHSQTCPVCGCEDIRAEYIPLQLKAYQDKIKEWQKQLAAEEIKLTKKIADKAKICWLVKVEYHT